MVILYAEALGMKGSRLVLKLLITLEMQMTCTTLLV